MTIEVVTPSSQHIELIVRAEAEANAQESLRLDQFLANKFSYFSRSYIQKLIAQGMVLVDGTQQKPGHRLKRNQQISVSVPPNKDLHLRAEAIPLDILYEDQYLAVVNKPAGMVTHPGAGVDSGTLVHALMHHMHGSLSGISGILRPGIVHRLDKDTSGLLAIAKDDYTHRKLAEQIQTKTAKRVYIALLEGDLKQDQGQIVAPIARHKSNRVKMSISERGRPAESHYKVLKRTHGYVLAQVELKTGRTHQIRVHMASLNCPVVADIVYNYKTSGSLKARKQLGLLGHALHATKLSFFHPISGRLLEFVAPLPADFANLLARLF